MRNGGVVRFLALWLLGSSSALAGFISGTVSGTNANPLSGMVVAAYSSQGVLASTTVTDPLGRYTLSLPAATYRLVAYDAQGNFAPNFYRDASSFETSAELALGAQTTLTSIDFRLVPAVHVSGFVTAQDGASPLTGMVVAAYNLDGTRRAFERTDGSGVYRLTLPPGQYRFGAYDESFFRATEFYAERRVFERAEIVTVNADLGGISFSLEPAARISGRVIERETRQVLSGISVFVYDLAGSVVASGDTGPAGTFQFAIPPGSYRIAAADPEGRFLVSFFGGGVNFEAAPSFSLSAGQWLTGVDFSLEKEIVPRTTTLYIAAVANAAGANNTQFQTDVWIQNPGARAIEVTVRYLPPAASAAPPTDMTVSVGAGSQTEFRNVLASLFGITGAGALRLSSSEPFVAMSRTFNLPPDAATVGTFGLAIPALPLSSSISKGVIPGLRSSEQFRSNVGVLNPQPHSLDVTFRLFRPTGQLLAEQTRSFQPLEWFQANTIFSFLNVQEPLEHAFLVVSSQGGSFFAYGSIVDQKNGDGTIVLAVGDPLTVNAPEGLGLLPSQR